jgi:hypothetical protein
METEKTFFQNFITFSLINFFKKTFERPYRMVLFYTHTKFEKNPRDRGGDD